jgi:VWFA-related protein
VVVDVVVTDKNDRPVHDLKQSDFAVFEDRAPQTIRNFEERSGAGPTLPEEPPSPAGVFSNYTTSPNVSATNVLLLDELDTPPDQQSKLIEQLKQFLHTVPAGTRIAIFGLKTSLTMLQGFTADPKQLLAALDGKGITSPAFAGAAENSVPITTNGGVGIHIFEAQRTTATLQLRSRTLAMDALEQLCRYLSVLPGRKNLLWFAGSFPLQVVGTPMDKDTTLAPDESIRTERLTNLFLASRVAVYPIDALGLYQQPGTDVSSRGVFSGRAAGAAQTAFSLTMADHISSMETVAENTGGRAFMNSNKLSDAVAAAIADGSHYYTLAYTPTNSSDDGRMRNIKVELAQRGLKLEYRRTYYAGNAAAKTIPTMDVFRSAMVHGAPDATQLIFHARVLPTSTGIEDQVAEGNHPNPKPEISKGPYRRLQVDLAVDLHPMLVRMTAERLLQLSLQYSIAVYDRDGVLVNEIDIAQRPKYTVEDFKEILKAGVLYHQQVSVPAKGEYFVRIGLRDLIGDHIGTVELPVAAVLNLPPSATQ